MKAGNSSVFSPKLAPAARLVAVALLALGCGTLGACGTDDNPNYTLALSVDRVTLTSDGSDFATVRVTVLDQRGYPPAIGSEVQLVTAGGADVSATGSESAGALTDAAGTAQFTLSCTGSDEIQVLANFSGERGFLPQEIACNPAPAGDWQLLLSATPRTVSPGGTSTMVVDALQGNGSPVPEGTSVIFEINEPNPGARFRTGSGSRQILQTADASGRLTNVVIAPTSEDNFTVCASFADQRLGAGERCLTVRVGELLIDEASCFAVYAPSEVPADGESTSILTFTVVDENGQPVGGAEIDALIGAGSFLENADDIDSVVPDIFLNTDSTGTAEVTILAPAATGSADVEATAIWDGVDDFVECQFSDELVFYPPPTCTFDPITPLTLGQTSNLRVCFDNLGESIGSGERVQFQLTSSVGGAALTATTAFTDSTGCATTGLATGAAPGGATVVATMPFGQSSSTCQTEAIIQSGGAPSANQMSLSCEFENLGALLTRNGVDVNSTCTMSCLTNVIDQFNNPVEGATVYFTSESGAITAFAQTDALGNAVATFTPRGQMPRQVSPVPGEPLGPNPGVDVTLNSRDGLVTIVASTVGQEPFNDDDGDGLYDEGEFFVDLSEPYVDSNEDDAFTVGSTHESFVDVAVPDRALNGTFDGPNGVWDSHTQIWAATRVVYSGGAANMDQAFFLNDALAPFNPNQVLGRSTESITFRPVDEHGNSLSSGTEFAVETTCDGVTVEGRALFVGDTSGPNDVGRAFRTFAGGREVPADSEVIERAEYRTFLGFGKVTAAFDVDVSVDETAEAEECTITVAWTEQVSSACAEGLVEQAVSFDVRLQ